MAPPPLPAQLPLKDLIRLGNDRHAIKEAVISLFFGSPFIEPVRFQGVLRPPLDGYFNQFELIRQFQVQLEGNQDTFRMQPTAPRVEDVGFQFTRYEQGNVVRVLTGRNAPDRVSLSLHTMRYERWDDFRELFDQLAAQLAPHLVNMVVLGCALHYVDELEWVGPGPLPLNAIYQRDQPYLPEHFFESPMSELLLNVQHEADGVPFFDRLHLTSTQNGRPVATISHYLVHQFASQLDLSAHLQLDQGSYLRQVLQAAHEQNKARLRRILQPAILDLINLPQ